MPNLLQKSTDRFKRMLFRTTARIPVKSIQTWMYTAALDACDFKTLNYLLDQKNVYISDNDRCKTITMVAAAHRWISNGGLNISYHAQVWIRDPLLSPGVTAEFLMDLLKKSMGKPLNNPSLEEVLLNDLQVVRSRSSHIHLDLSANDFVLTKIKFSPQIIPFVVIKTLDTYTNTSVLICDRSTCDELLRRHFKKIDWMMELEPEKTLRMPDEYAWKEIVHSVPEPYLLSLIRSHKKLVHDPGFIERVLYRDFSYKVWNSMCENGCTSEEIQSVNYVPNQDNMRKALECCEHLAAQHQRKRLIKGVEEKQEQEQEQMAQPKKRKM